MEAAQKKERANKKNHDFLREYFGKVFMLGGRTICFRETSCRNVSGMMAGFWVKVDTVVSSE